SELLEPREQPLNLPSQLVTPERSAVLRCGILPVRFVRRDHLDASLGQLFIQRIEVISLIADQSLRCLSGKKTSARVVWIRVTSCGIAATMWPARIRPLPSATVMSFVLLTRLVFPTPSSSLVRSDPRCQFFAD